MALDRFGDIQISPGDEGSKDRESRDEKNLSPVPGAIPAAQEKTPDNRADIAVASEPVRTRPGRHPSGRDRRTFPMVRWLFILLVAVALYGATAYFLIPILMQKIVVPSVAARLARPVEINRIVFSPFTLRVFLSGIRIKSHDAERQSAPALLQSAGLRCQLGLEQIFSGKLTCKAIVLEDVHINLQRTSEGFSDLGDLVNILGLQYTGTFENIWPSWLTAGEFTLSGGTIVLRDSINSREYLVEKLELYLPPTHLDSKSGNRLPELSAVVNGSPVHVEAVRILNSEGRLETSLNLRVRDAYLVHYLDYLPLHTAELRLADGRADVNLRIIFPVGAENRDRFILDGDASLSGVRVEGKDAQRIAVFPEIRFGFSVIPREKQLRIENMRLSQPELDVFLGTGSKEASAGLAPAEMTAFAASAVRSERPLHIGELQAMNGKIQFFKETGGEPAFVWEDVSWKLRNFATPGSLTKDGEGGKPAYFAFNAADKSGVETMSLTAEGQIHPGRGGGGRFAVTHLDLQKYGNMFPLFGLVFAQGTGDIRFSYDYAAGKAGTELESGYSFLLSDGYVDLVDFSLHSGGDPVRKVAGRKLTCEGLQADPASRNLTCERLVVADSAIDLTAQAGTGPSASRRDREEWQMKAGEVQVSGSKLRTSFLHAICPAAPDLVLDDIGLTAANVFAADKEAKVSLAAKLGTRGKVNLRGGYSALTDHGRLNVSLQDIDFTLLGPCLAQVLIPEVTQGELDLLGTYALPERELTGRVAVRNMTAGTEQGPLISWQNGEAEKVFLHLKPLVLDLGSVRITRPEIRPGVTNSEVVLDNFIRPAGHLFDQLTAAEIHVEEGGFTLPWPVILPGYQPELSGLEGKLEILGRAPSSFSLQGRVDGFADFTLTGVLDRKSVRSYSLALSAMRFAPFSPYLLQEFGLPADPLLGRLEQKLERSDAGTEIERRLFLQGVDPEADASFYPLFALMVGETGEMTIVDRDRLPRDAQPPFLLPALKRYFQHQEVRAAIDQRLVLKEALPDINLPAQMHFEPGSAEVPDPQMLAGYELLLAKRPLLAVSLHPFYDADSDRAALQAVLQKEADRKRDAENRRRALEKSRRKQEELQKMAAVKEGKTPIIVEEITGPEPDLEPLPVLQVNVSAPMLENLARRRVAAVADYLSHTLHIEPARIRVDDTVNTGDRKVALTLFPVQSTTDRGKGDEH